MKRQFFASVCAFVFVAILCTACGAAASLSPSSSKSSLSAPTTSSDAPGGYLDSEPSYVLFVQWTEKGGQMSGQLQEVYVNQNSPFTVQTNNEAFTGTHDSSNVSISTSIFGYTKTFTGSLNGDTLTLVVPNSNGTLATLTLHSASVGDYNQAATSFEQNINQQAAQATATVDAYVNTQLTATAQATLHQAVADANSAVSQDFQYLNKDRKILQQEQDLSNALSPYVKDIKTMQNDLAKEKADASQGCGSNGYNYSQVGYDESQVGYDKSQIGYDDSTFQYAYQQVSNDIDIVNKRIATAQSDWTTLQNALASDAPGGPGAAYSQQDFTNEIQSTQAQVTTTKDALSSQSNTATGYDSQAQQLYQEAESVYNNMHC